MKEFKIITCSKCGEEWSGNITYGEQAFCNKCANKWNHGMDIKERFNYSDLYKHKKNEGKKYNVELNFFELDMIIRGLMELRENCQVEIFKQDDCISKVIGKLNTLKPE